MEKPACTGEELADVLQLALQTGQVLLESGANTARIEDAIVNVGLGLGADRMEAFVTPSGMIVTAASRQETRTRVQRNLHSGVQLSKVIQVTNLVSAVTAGQLSRLQTGAELERIKQIPRSYSPWLTAVSVGIACSAFLVLFGGTWTEAAVVLITGTLAQILRHFLLQARVGRLLCTSLVAALATFLALLCTSHWGLSEQTVAASLLLLVPGVPLISGTADLFRGDTLAGLARTSSALLTVIAGAVGVWAVILLSGQIVELQVSRLQAPGLTLAMGLLSAGGFAVLFDVPPRCLVWAGLVGAVATGTRLWALQLGLPSVAAFFVAGVALGTVAKALAIWRRVPSSTLTIPGYIPLVPGAVALNAILHLVRENYAAGLAELIRAGLLLMSVAIGQGVVRSVWRSNN